MANIISAEAEYGIVERNTKSQIVEKNRYENMSNIGFGLMSLMFKVRSALNPPKRLLDEMEIKEGMTIVDYGCGPGSYIKDASEMAGDSGTVYAADINPLAVAAVDKITQKSGLKNVKTVKVDGYHCPVDDNQADLIYALDMFHAVDDPKAFLTELHRVVKPDGVLIIDSGHQPAEEAKEKIVSSGLWKITEERDIFMRCSPLQ